ncbi:hypothetical protein CEXT_692931, partial [Caerostris extrusa]
SHWTSPTRDSIPTSLNRTGVQGCTSSQLKNDDCVQCCQPPFTNDTRILSVDISARASGTSG